MSIERLRDLQDLNTERARIMTTMRARFESLRNRHENGIAPRAISSFNLFQTPAVLAARMVEILGIEPGCSLLEPSAGLGRLLAPTMGKRPGFVCAVDISPDCTRELSRLFPSIDVVCCNFLEEHLGEFDRIIMNPPFKMRDDIRHILHAADHLAPGGVLVGLCLHGSHRVEKLRPLCEHWEVIPAGTFAAEGTQVETVLFSIEKDQ